MLEISLIEFVLWMFVSAFTCSLAACVVVIWWSARMLPRRTKEAFSEILESNPELIGEVTAEIMGSAIAHMRKTYEEDPEAFAAMLGPLVGVVVKKVKDHLFSAKGNINKAVKGELSGLQGDLIEQVTGGMVSAKLIEEYPLVGGLIEMAMSNPQILQRLGIPIPGAQSAGAASEAIGGLIQQ